MAPDRSKAGGNRNRPDVLTDPRAIQRVHLDHHQISSHQNVVKTIQDTPITDLKDVEVDKTSDDFAAGQSLVWGGDSWIAGDPEVLIPVKAAEEMTKGTPVYVSDEQESGKPIVSKADSDGTDTYPAIGLLFTDLAAGAEGHAVGGGIISGLDTSGYAVGDALYLSSTPGVLTNTRPTATAEKVQKVAVVARSHASAGTVIVMGAGRTNDVPNELTALTGVPLGDSDLGTFPPDTNGFLSPIAPNETIKGALEDLSLEANALSARIAATASGLGGLETEVAGLVTYHGRYDTEAEARRDDNDGAITQTEIYYTARPDGDGYAESEVTASTPAGAVIERRLFYSDKFDADVNTPADWTAYTTQPADDTAFATAKASLLAGLSNTDGTANTRGALPLSLKMEHTFVTDKLLNDYPALAGFSVRLIRFGYSGNCLKVRRSSDNSELDIGFDSNGNLDISAIETHCGSSDGFVSVWYDQSGNGNNVTQTVTSLQPKIYDGSAVMQDNGRPAIQAISSSNYLRWPGTIITGTGARSMLCVANADSAVNDNFLTLSSAATGNGEQWNWTPEVRIRVIGDRRYDNNPMDTQTIGMLTFPAGGDTTDIDFYENGTQATVSTVTTAYAINTGTSGFAYIHSTLGKMQEMVLWTSDQDSNVTDINNDADTYYDVTNTTALLNQFSGAAAAYSVRCLTSLGPASVCMKVRRDSDNATQNIGFGSNGDLDTAAIATFCGAANGYVAVWYDQSGNGNHMAQATTSLQPQIYDGSSVITRNGKPTVKFDTVSGAQGLVATGLSVSNRSRTMFSVTTTESSTADSKVVARGFSSTYSYWSAINGVRLISQAFRTSGRIDTFTGVAETVGQQIFRTDLANTVTSTLYKNGTSVHSVTDQNADWSYSTFGMGGLPAHAGGGSNHTIAELVVYESDQGTNRTGIESNINTYYGVTTQLLLDTYSGAAAAYSVRKLSQWYTGNCMKVRRDSDDTTQDIGFDSSGNLDTAAIKSFCDAGGAGTLGYVHTWYDQSGSGRHLSQTGDDAKQPQIYDGTAVITANGKPALDPRSGAARLYSATTTISPTMTIMLVKSGHGGAFGAPLWYATGAATLVWDRNSVGAPGPYYGIATALHYATPPTDAIWTMKYGSDSATRSNGSQVATTTGNTVSNMSRVVLGGRYEAATGAWSGKAHELIIWDVDHYSTAAAELESNANTYFGIF